MTFWANTRRRVRAASINVAVALISISVALLLAELVVRMVAPQQLVTLRPDIWQPLDSVGWRFRPNVRATYNTGERLVHVVTDSNGFRTSRAGRPTGAQRLLVIGDSFMAALQVEYEASFSGLLETRLPTALGHLVEVWNTGQVAWDPPQYYLQEMDELGRSRFDVVLVSIFLGNDIVNRWPHSIPPRQPEVVHRLRWPTRLTKAEVIDAWFYPMNDLLEVHSQLFIFLKTRMQDVLWRAGLTSRYFPDEFLRSDTASVRWHVTTQICQAMAAAAGRYDTPIVFMLVPTSYQVSPAAFDEYVKAFRLNPGAVDLDQPTRLMTDSLRAHGLVTLDVLPAFRKAAEQGKQLYGSVDPHLSPDGNEALEELVEPTVVQLLRGRR